MYSFCHLQFLNLGVFGFVLNPKTLPESAMANLFFTGWHLGISERDFLCVTGQVALDDIRSGTLSKAERPTQQTGSTKLHASDSGLEIRFDKQRGNGPHLEAGYATFTQVKFPSICITLLQLTPAPPNSHKNPYPILAAVHELPQAWWRGGSYGRCSVS